MWKIRYLLPTMVLILFGCGGDADPSGPGGDGSASGDPETRAIARIAVQGPVVMLWDTGLSARLTAIAMDSDGQSIPGVTFEWVSEDASVATVVGGLVTATGDGWTEVAASSQGESSGVSIVVVTPAGAKDRTDCVACHADAYIGQHGGSNTPEACLQCHTRDGWTGTDFDHPAAANGFELLGAHRSLACASCHEADGSPRYPGVADDECIACHQSDYAGQHDGSGYPTTCLQCHTRDGWTGADFDHPAAANGFELLGAHRSLACASCHEADGSPRYPGVADDECIACHQSDYDGQHDGSGYPTTCLQCHTRDGWTGADFDHPAAANGFELLGAHRSLACASCHEADGSPRYPGVADDECIACHQSDYDGQHDGSGYPTTCLTCHTRDAWSGADFNHDAQYFPILAGRHSGRWGGCSTCHVDSSNYTNFSCFACHPHDQNRMDDKHSGMSGYSYDSDRCYACHPRGEAD